MIDRGSRSLTLTPRELQVARLVAAGLNNPAIAEQLCISRETVKSHVSNILNRLGLENRRAIRDAIAKMSDGPAFPAHRRYDQP